ncbi:MAG TPA: hypothetical protein VFK42_07615 [Acidimicrobiales bacterium]|nr:hypothetical protein [Acidimicrobiales bacterium]
MTLRVTLVAAVVAFAVAFGAIAPPERCPDVTVASVRGAAARTVAWFERNQRDDGSWLYEYDRDSGRETPEYNVVRHAGAVMGLFQAARDGVSRTAALRAGDRGLSWALSRTSEAGDGAAALDVDGTQPTGASALLAAGLVHRRDATGDRGYDTTLRRYGRFLVTNVEPSGAVRAYGRPGPGFERYSKYYTGETFWALALLARTFPDEAVWRSAAARVQHYLATRRDKAEDHFPPVPDHWAAYGMAELGRTDPAVVRYAHRQAELFGLQVRSVAQRFGPWGRLVRGRWVPRGGGYGVVGEALGQLARLSDVTPALASARGAIAERDRCIVGLALHAQTTSSRDPRAQGAWFRDGVTRMDDQQHAMSALLGWLSSPVRSESGDESPSPWLWAAALVLLADPARLALPSPRTRRRSAPQGDRSTPSSLGVVVVAAAAAAIAVAAIAAVSGPVLDAMDVSAPAARLAAGAVLAVVAIVHLVRRPPLHVGVAAAPVVLLAAGHDAGVLVVTLAAVVAATAASALPAIPALRWVTRGFAAALLATAIALAVAGVLAV